MNGQWSHVRRLSGAVLGTLAVAVVAPLAMSAAAPPASDSRGYVDSTARCASPNRAVAYGYTSSSRVAICKDDSSGQYQYRGVRVTDGAKLILAAWSTANGYVAENDGITYTVTDTALVISSGGKQIRDETMIDFHGTAGSSSTSPSPPRRPSSAPTTSVQPSAALPRPPPRRRRCHRPCPRK